MRVSTLAGEKTSGQSRRCASAAVFVAYGVGLDAFAARPEGGERLAETPLVDADADDDATVGRTGLALTELQSFLRPGQDRADIEQLAIEGRVLVMVRQ